MTNATVLLQFAIVITKWDVYQKIGTYFNNSPKQSFPKQITLKEIRKRSGKLILCPPHIYMTSE